jgi:DNA polymerase-3 subunit alpha
LTNLDRLVSMAQREAKLRESGQATMFDLFGDQVSTPMPALELEPSPVPRAEELAWEKELLGVYVSEHPFTAAAGTLSTYVSAVASELSDAPGQVSADDDEGSAPVAASAPLPPQGRDVVIAGMVGNTRRLYTRDSRAFCAAEIEDMSGAVEVTVWPEIYERTQELWMEGNILLLQVRQRERNGRIGIAVQQVELYQLADGTSAGFVAPSWAAVVDARREARDAESSVSEPSIGAVPPNGDFPSEPRSSSSLNGHLNGVSKPVQSNGVRTNGTAKPRPPSRSSTPPPAPRQPAVATATRMLRIELQESEDEDADRDRLGRLLDVLR